MECLKPIQLVSLSDEIYHIEKYQGHAQRGDRVWTREGRWPPAPKEGGLRRINPTLTLILDLQPLELRGKAFEV